jgi:hypothetical protein
MGQAKKNRRDCPVIGHVISSAECGENRGSQYACPAGCPHNPWSPANYDQALKIEDGVTLKMMDRLNAPPPPSIGDFDKELVLLAQFYMQQFHLARDGQGRNFFDQWEAEGWAGLKNDERFFIRHKACSRYTLLEIHRVFDDQCEVVDLLSPGSAPFLVHDRGMAREAIRFEQVLSWEFPMPHYHRLNGNGLHVPDVSGFDGLDVVRETVRHLGGPVELEPMRDWLAANTLRLADSFHALQAARHDQMMSATDVRFSSATYRLRGNFQSLRDQLAQLPSVAEDNLSDKELAQGFEQALVWFDEPSAASPQQPHLDFPAPITAGFGRRVLGRVLLKTDAVRIEADGAAYQALRVQFEKQAGKLVEFQEERVEDIAGQLRQKHKTSYDAALVPTCLLQTATRLILSASHIEPSSMPHGASLRELEAISHQEYLRSFLQRPVPLLDDRTPRQAAADPAMRPRLLTLLKQFIRSHDRANLEKGRTDDINWLLRDLGATELIFDPPPLRPIPAYLDAEQEEDWLDEQPLPCPTLPAGPLSEEEALDRLEAVRAEFPDVNEMQAAFREEAPDLMALIESLTKDTGGKLDMDVFVVTSSQLWFSFFPSGTACGIINHERFRSEFDQAALKLSSIASSAANHVLETGRQPHLVGIIASTALQNCIQNKELRNSVSAKCLVLLVMFLHALANELDMVVREMRQQR